MPFKSLPFKLKGKTGIDFAVIHVETLFYLGSLDRFARFGSVGFIFFIVYALITVLLLLLVSFL